MSLTVLPTPANSCCVGFGIDLAAIISLIKSLRLHSVSNLFLETPEMVAILVRLWELKTTFFINNSCQVTITGVQIIKCVFIQTC